MRLQLCIFIYLEYSHGIFPALVGRGSDFDPCIFISSGWFAEDGSGSVSKIRYPLELLDLPPLVFLREVVDPLWAQVTIDDLPRPRTNPRILRFNAV